MSVEIVLDRADRTYHPGEKVSGAVVVRSQGSMSHSGIKLSVNGSVSLQLSARSVGLFEAFYSSIKPVELVQYNIDVAASGKVPSGVTQFPFAFILKGYNNRPLEDTYHGVYVNTQYIISVEIPRSMLAKNLKKSLEFIVEVASVRIICGGVVVCQSGMWCMSVVCDVVGVEEGASCLCVVRLFFLFFLYFFFFSFCFVMALLRGSLGYSE